MVFFPFAALRQTRKCVFTLLFFLVLATYPPTQSSRNGLIQRKHVCRPHAEFRRRHGSWEELESPAVQHSSCSPAWRAPLLKLRGGVRPRSESSGKRGRKPLPKKKMRYRAGFDPPRISISERDPEQRMRELGLEAEGPHFSARYKTTDFAPDAVIGRDLQYEYSWMKGHLLFHPDTMEPFNFHRFFLDDPNDPFQAVRVDPRDMDDAMRERMKNPHLYIQGIRDKVDEYFYLKRTRIEAMQVAVEQLTSAHNRNQQQLKRFQTPVRFFVNSSQSLPQTISMCTKPSIGRDLASTAGDAHSPPPPPVSIIFDHGWHAWPSINSKQLLCIPNGTLHLLGAGDAPWLSPVQDREGEESTAHEDSVHKGRKATTLFGSLWMDEDSRGTCCKLKLLQNHTRDRRSFALKAYEYLLEEENQEEWEGVQEGIEDMDPFDDPFACVAVFGDWNFSFCDLRGGYDHVMSLRESGSVNVSYCYFNNLPQDGDRDPVKHPLHQMYDVVNNRTLPFHGAPPDMTGIVCYHRSLARAEGCVFGDLLWCGMRAIDESRMVAEGCVFATFQTGMNFRDDSRSYARACQFNTSVAALFVEHRSSLLAVECNINQAVFGLMLLGNSTSVIKSSTFYNCTDGVFFSIGEPTFQKAQLEDNHVVCFPNEERECGYTWLSLQRPKTLVERNNTVINDPYYPGTSDIAAKYDMFPNVSGVLGPEEFGQLLDWFDNELEDDATPEQDTSATLSRIMDLDRRLATIDRLAKWKRKGLRTTKTERFQRSQLMANSGLDRVAVDI